MQPWMSENKQVRKCSWIFGRSNSGSSSRDNKHSLGFFILHSVDSQWTRSRLHLSANWTLVQFPLASSLRSRLFHWIIICKYFSFSPCRSENTVVFHGKSHFPATRRKSQRMCDVDEPFSNFSPLFFLQISEFWISTLLPHIKCVAEHSHAELSSEKLPCCTHSSQKKMIMHQMVPPISGPMSLFVCKSYFRYLPVPVPDTLLVFMPLPFSISTISHRNADISCFISLTSSSVTPCDSAFRCSTVTYRRTKLRIICCTEWDSNGSSYVLHERNVVNYLILEFPFIGLLRLFLNAKEAIKRRKISEIFDIASSHGWENT